MEVCQVGLQAIGKLTKLKVLAVHQWKALVGLDTNAAQPLRNMPCLKYVFVDGGVTGAAFNVPGVTFKSSIA